jgi:elongation factor G
VRVTLTFGSYHEVDSSEMAFKIAAAMAFEKACRDSRPVLLEPVLEVEVTCPDAYAGDVMDDLQKKRAHILGFRPDDGLQRIQAHVPEAEMLRYGSDLRSITGGWGRFVAKRHHYAEVPPAVADKIVASRQSALREAAH